MFRDLIQALPAYGPVLLFLLIVVESMGLPVPGETIVVAAAAFAAAGRMSLTAVVVAAVLGGVVGGMGGYWIGRRGLVRLAVRSRSGALERTRAFFARRGGMAIVGGRFIAFVRSFLGLAAGMAGMPFGSFMVWNAAGAGIWAGAFAALGYVFGRNLPRLERALAVAGFMFAVLVALLVGVFLVVRVAWPRRAEVWAWVERGWARILASPGARALEQRLPRSWGFVRARFSPMTFLGAYVVVGLVVSLLSLSFFGGVLEDMVAGESLVRFDLALARWAEVAATPGGIAVARVLSFLGSPLVLTLLAISGVSRFLFRRQRIPAFGWAASLAGAAVLAVVLERVVRRPVPTFPDPGASGSLWSFPSAHALGGLVAYGMLAYLAATLRLERLWSRVVVTVVAGALVLAIGASRMYLGVEYFSDVIGGYAAGAVWLGACIFGVELTWRASMPASPG